MAIKSTKTKAPFRAGFLIHDASRLRRTVLDQRFKPLGVTRSQWWVLSHLSRGESEGLSQVELARLLDVGKVTLGGLIDRLEENGVVVRVLDPTDRRSKRVTMSPKGERLLRELEGIALEINRDIMAGITDDDEGRLIDILSRMKHNLKLMDAVPAHTANAKPKTPGSSLGAAVGARRPTPP
jgi:MarR family transcriptional regulator, transcriptional regulator for hemolysin